MCKVLDPNKETIVDIDCEIYEPVLTLGLVTKLKKKVGLQISLIPEKVQVSIKSFVVEPTFPFPEFIHWSASHFSSAKRVIIYFDRSKVLCQVNSQSIREELCLYKLNEYVQFDEKESISSFREMSPEQKTEFLSKFLKSDQNIEGLSLLYSIDLFNNSIQRLFSLMIQILGLNDDKLVSEVMLRFLVKFGHFEEKNKCLNFDEFLVEKIHS